MSIRPWLALALAGVLTLAFGLSARVATTHAEEQARSLLAWLASVPTGTLLFYLTLQLIRRIFH